MRVLFPAMMEVMCAHEEEKTGKRAPNVIVIMQMTWDMEI